MKYIIGTISTMLFVIIVGHSPKTYYSEKPEVINTTIIPMAKNKFNRNISKTEQRMDILLIKQDSILRIKNK